MRPRVFVKGKDGRLVSVQEDPFENEDALQALLESSPELISPSAEDGVRFVLVRREQPVPGSEGGSGRWSVDHLFLDSDGIPTLVEVKRSTDTRIRREVVGQMLDYAANAVAYWPQGELISELALLLRVGAIRLPGELLHGVDPHLRREERRPFAFRKRPTAVAQKRMATGRRKCGREKQELRESRSVRRHWLLA